MSKRKPTSFHTEGRGESRKVIPHFAMQGQAGRHSTYVHPSRVAIHQARVGKSQRQLAHEEKLKKMAIEDVIDNYDSYQSRLEQEGEEEDIYNDFDDELQETLDDDKVTAKDQDFIMKFIKTREFWNRLYKKEPDMKGKIMW